MSAEPGGSRAGDATSVKDNVVVQVRGLTKHYGERAALADVDLNVTTGTCHGVFGHNGSGKTTLLKILATLIRPTRGRVIVAGHPLPREAAEVRRKLCVLLEAPFMPRSFTLRQGLEYVADLYDVDGSTARIEAIAERVGLVWRLRDPLRTFSRGMAQRASVATLLLADPEILVLDEPFTGLDHAGCQLVEDLIRESTERQRTVILVTHELERGARLCQDVVVLKQGRVVLTRRAGEWDFGALMESLK